MPTCDPDIACVGVLVPSMEVRSWGREVANNVTHDIAAVPWEIKAGVDWSWIHWLATTCSRLWRERGAGELAPTPLHADIYAPRRLDADTI